MKYYLDRIYKIMLHARSLAEANNWEELEDYADEKLDEVILLANKALASTSGMKESFAEEMRWEFWSAIVGSHYIDTKIGNHEFVMNMNIQEDAPILLLT